MLRRETLVEDTGHEDPDLPSPASPIPPALAPVLMMVFWMLLGGAAGIKIMEAFWRILGAKVGEVAIAVPVGGAVGGLAGALLGLISNPRLLVLLMAVFAGASAGGVAGQLPWGDAGEVAGQVAGGLVGGIAWTIWMLLARRRDSELCVRAASHKPDREDPIRQDGTKTGPARLQRFFTTTAERGTTMVIAIRSTAIGAFGSRTEAEHAISG